MIAPQNKSVTRTLSQSDWSLVLSALRTFSPDGVYLANQLNLPQCESSVPVQHSEIEKLKEEISDLNTIIDDQATDIRILKRDFNNSNRITIDYDKLFVNLIDKEDENDEKSR